MYTTHKIIPRAWHYGLGDTIQLYGDHRPHTIIEPVWEKKRHLLLSTGIIISHDTPVDIGALPYDYWWKQIHEVNHGRFDETSEE